MKKIVKISLVAIALFSVEKMFSQETIKTEAINAAETMKPTPTTETTDKATPTAAPSSAAKQEPVKQEPKKADAKKESTTNKKDAPAGQKMAINEQGVPTKAKAKAKQVETVKDSLAPEKK